MLIRRYEDTLYGYYGKPKCWIARGESLPRGWCAKARASILGWVPDAAVHPAMA